MFALCAQIMKKDLHIRITERRLNKLRLLAVEKEKTITQIVEELIDTLPEPKRENITQP
ncbi:hypothetical protein NIES22_51110 [Calothrix brevissima NIES-22]|nr:hypothetical protein NIES22_51110 [Calothrix brevissima NIES-22]